jgi:hypothetical protein
LADTDLTPLWRLNPTVSRRTSDAIAEALALDPADRPASVVVLLDRLGIDREGLDLAGVDQDAEPDRSAGADEAATQVVASRGRPEGLATADLVATEVLADAAAAPVPATTTAGADHLPPPGEDPSWRPADPARRADPAPPAEPRTVAAHVAASDDPAARPGARSAGAPPAGSWVVPAPTAPAQPVPAGPTPAPHRRATDPQPPALLGTPAGRRWVTLPLAAAAIGLCSAQPVTLTFVLGVVIAPILATVGDVLAQPERSPAWAPLWWLRNVAVGFVRSLGSLVVLAIGLCLWFGTDAFDALAPAAPWVLRVTGMATGAILATSIARGGQGFRSHVAIDALTRRVCPRGTVTVAAVVVVLVGVALAAAGLAFQPEAYPLG